MIICHPLKLIFLKTKKVGGTSFEVALSKFCGSDCIITPISPDDEQVRRDKEFRTAQNFLVSNRVGIQNPDSVNYQLLGDFANHSSSQSIHINITRAMRDAYTVVAIHRAPADMLVSQYFYRMHSVAPQERPSFAQWFVSNKSNVVENYVIAPVTGAYQCDTVLSYETLEEDIENCGLFPSEFYSVFSELSLKSQYRGRESLDIASFYAKEGVNPDELNTIVEPYVN